MAINLDELAESLSPIERKILPFIEKIDMDSIRQETQLDRTSIIRALEFLSNKEIIILKIEKKKVVDLGINGIRYKKNELPERILLHLIAEKPLALEEAKKQSKLSDNEFKAALGVLKKKAFVELKNGKMILTARKDEIIKKTLEEQFIEALPLNLEELSDEQKYAYESLKGRKDIISIFDKQEVSWQITETGNSLLKRDLVKLSKTELIETLTSEMIKKGSWQGKKFRRYDIHSKLPRIYGGKKHFVSQAIEQGRKIWTEMGFKEMTGNLIQNSFWNFDALFTAQDHPVREMQDTFFMSKKDSLKEIDKKIISDVKKAHESGVGNSKGWQYSWSEEEAEKLVLRTHTTCLSAQTLAKLKNLKDKTGKFFSIGKCFRNETVDWSHGFEFNQTEGIVIDKNANFRHLLGYLKEFYKKMGFEKIRFAPAYFPYTEPSVEIHIWHEERKVWLELGGAGMFRPELTIPLLGEHIPVLAWGQGFDRIVMDFFEIKDLRQMYENDLNQLRKMKVWRENG